MMVKSTVQLFARSCFLIIGLVSASAAGWPQGYVVHDGTESPDGQYGIIVPEEETTETGAETSINCVANLKTHRSLGQIKGSDYFEHQNHAGLSVTWAKDSSIAVANYESRFGSWSIIVIEPTASKFVQTEIGKHIQTAIDAVIAKQAHERDAGGYVSPLFRIEPGRKIRVYATALTNPKQLEDAKSYFALFRGLYDLPAKKWIKSEARPLTSKENDLLESASTSYDAAKYQVSPEAFKDSPDDAEEPLFVGDNVCFRSEASEFKYVDDKMNEVYKAARIILSPSEFAKVQVDQRGWLKKRDATASLGEKSKLTIARIEALQDASW
jgi:uncharacterized protein YecT (DUF1311 family)